MTSEPARLDEQGVKKPPRGILKIYLGYAAGSGKTYQMLDEGQEFRRQGVDLVIGYFEPHGRKDTIAKAEGLEIVPRRKIAYRGAVFEEMDLPALLKRRPEVCLVDELAHTNVPGSEREKRWQDVQALLDSGIDVLTTLNVQHIESLNDPIEQMTGVRVRETVPDWVVNEADEVVVVDVTPRALRNRLLRGVVYAPEKATQAMENFFTEANLTALRELAFRQTAHKVEDRLEREAVLLSPDDGKGSREEPETREKIMVVLTTPPSATLVRRGKRVADFLQAESRVVFVCPDTGWRGVPPVTKDAVEKLFHLADNLQMKTEVLIGSDAAQTLADYAHREGVTQMYLSKGPRIQRSWFFRKTLIERIIERASDIQLILVSE